MDSMISAIITGWHSGPNPSPGLGVARCLRLAWPDMRVVAVDYSRRSTGLNDPIADEVIVLPPWKEVEPTEQARRLVAMARSSEAALISGLDLEVSLLAKVKGEGDDSQLVLSPSEEALRLVKKPCVDAAAVLGLLSPASAVCSRRVDSRDFASLWGWPLMVKGSRYESLRAGSPSQLDEAIDYVERTWSEHAILQQRIDGREHSYAFCALNGRVLSSCHMEKTEVTGEGKTWCGRVRALTPTELEKVSRFSALSNWTGGCEVEMLRETSTGQDYLIDLNPRFPAWVYGGALSGFNLPASLYAAAMGLPYEDSGEGGDFVRQVMEVRARYRCPSSPPRASGRAAVGGKGHPSGMPQLSRAVLGRERSVVEAHEVVDAAVLGKLRRCAEAIGADDVPKRVFFPDVLSERTTRLVEMAQRLTKALRIEVRPTYSVKTNPCSDVLGVVAASGIAAETISLAELRHAVGTGAEGSRCILNGPGKWWPGELIRSVPEPGIINCDSLEDLEFSVETMRLLGWQSAAIGVRIAPPLVQSRFGCDLSDPELFMRLCAVLKELPPETRMGFHFHFASSSIGVAEWVREARAAMELAAGIAAATGRRVSFLGFGGGWRLPALEPMEEALFETLSSLPAALSGVRECVLEIGKLLVEDSAMFVCRVIGTRSAGEGLDVVVGASIGDMPDVPSFPHPLYWMGADGAWRELMPGAGRVLGRICMEGDVLANRVFIPDEMRRGDLIVFGDAGAYDASMSYRFGDGGHRD